MTKAARDNLLTTLACVLLLFTGCINWNVYSWLILVALIVIVAAWYLRSSAGAR
jgi:hypothetical protein